MFCSQAYNTIQIWTAHKSFKNQKIQKKSNINVAGSGKTAKETICSLSMANENTLLLLLKQFLKFHYPENLQLSMPECFMMTISTHLPTQPGKTESIAACHSSLGKTAVVLRNKIQGNEFLG